MSSFAKLDAGIVDSTLWMQPHDVLRVWIALMAKADASGYVRASVPSLAHLCMVPIERLEQILAILTSPDPYSRTPTDEGRRLRAVEGGWELVNYLGYRNARDEDAERARKREWDRQNRPSGSSRARQVPKAPEGEGNPESDSLTRSDAGPTAVRRSDGNPTGPTQAEAEAEEELESADADLSASSPTDTSAAARGEQHGEQPPGGRPPCPHRQIIALYHEVLPELRRVRDWNDTRRRLLARRWAEQVERQTLAWWREFFGYVRRSRFLMGQTSGRDGRPFDCDLEWLIRPQNFTKVVEGKYEDAAA